MLYKKNSEFESLRLPCSITGGLLFLNLIVRLLVFFATYLSFANVSFSSGHVSKNYGEDLPKLLHFYFSNDSVNGLKVSDAYFTHRMGVEYYHNPWSVNVDLSLLTPDMFKYQNEYRKADLSFGEFLSVRIARQFRQHEDQGKSELYVRAVGQDRFGIAGLQSWVHRLASFQDDYDLLENVRMPKALWVGAGFQLFSDLTADPFGLPASGAKVVLGGDGYVGSDSAFLAPFLEISDDIFGMSIMGRATVRAFGYNNIIASGPVYATPRKINPEIKVGLAKQFGEYLIYAEEVVGLPPIVGNDDLFIKLNMGIIVPFHKLGELLGGKVVQNSDEVLG